MIIKQTRKDGFEKKNLDVDLSIKTEVMTCGSLIIELIFGVIHVSI